MRLAVLAHHYRSDWEWHDDLLHAGGHPAGVLAGGQRAPGTVRARSLVDEVRAALDDDLDTPGAVATIDAALTSGGAGKSQADISEATGLLGVLL